MSLAGGNPPPARTDQRTQRRLRPRGRRRRQRSTPTNSTRRVLRLPGEAVIDPGPVDRRRRRCRGQPLRRRSHLRRGLRRPGGGGRGSGRENRPRQPRRRLRRRGRFHSRVASTSPTRAMRRSRSSNRRASPRFRRPSTAPAGRRLQLAGRRSAGGRREPDRRQRAPARRRRPQAAAPSFPRAAIYEFDASGPTWTGCRRAPSARRAKRGTARSSANPPGSRSIPTAAISTSRPATAKKSNVVKYGPYRTVCAVRAFQPAKDRARRRGAARCARERSAPARRRAALRHRRRLRLRGRTAPRRAGQLRRQADPARAAPPRHGAGGDRRRRQDLGAPAAAGRRSCGGSRSRSTATAISASTGLPVCRVDQIQPSTTDGALAACRRSLVGEGHFSANVKLPEQSPFPSARQGPRLQRQGQRQAGDPRPHLRHPAGADLDRAALPAQRAGTAPTARPSKPRCPRRPAVGGTSPACG